MAPSPDPIESSTATVRGAPESIALDYIKSNFFRVVYADGVWGGVTPTGDIHAAFWNERPAIPKRMVFAVSPDGSLGDEVRDKREAREGLVREVEVGLVMRLQTAKKLLGWLETVIGNAEKFGMENSLPVEAAK